MDEFHFYADPQRGWAWQVPLLTLPHVQFVLMSATLGDVTTIADDLSARTGRETAVVTGVERPVPLSLRVRDDAGARDDRGAARHPARPRLHRALLAGGGARAGAGAHLGEDHHPRAARRDRRGDRRVPLHHPLRADALAARPLGHRRAPRGHAAEVPPARRAARAAGAAARHLRHRHARRRHQRAHPHRAAHGPHEVRRHPDASAHRRASSTRSRAARAAPATTPPARWWRRRPSTRPRTRSSSRKLGDDPKKRRKLVRKKAPDGFVSWGEPSFEKLIDAEPEPLALAHAGEPLDAAQRHRPRRRRVHHDARRSSPRRHEPWRAQLALARRALAIYRTLRTAGVVEQHPDPTTPTRPRASASPSTCSRTSRSTSRCRRSRSPSSSARAGIADAIRSTSSR